MSSFTRLRATPSRLNLIAPLLSRRSYARLTLIGNLGNTPELSTTSTGKEVIKYAIASSHGTRENPKTSWFNISHFQPSEGQRNLFTSLEKGTLVHVEADAQMSVYTDEQTNKSHKNLNLALRNLEILRKPNRPEAEDQQIGEQPTEAGA